MCLVEHPVVPAESIGVVLGAEPAALLQQGNNVIDEIVQTAGQIRRHDVETVGRARIHPGDQIIGDRLRGTGNTAMTAPATEFADQFADGEVTVGGQLTDQGRSALVSLDRRLGREIRQAIVQ